MASNSFKAIIEGYFQRNGGWLRLKGDLAVYYWPRVAGSEIASKVTAFRVSDGFLYLRTDNAALAHQISLLNFDIIKKYKKLLGANLIKGVKIKIGPIDPKLNKKRKNEVEIKLNFEEEQMIEKCGHQISEPDLAVKFTMLMKKHYVLKRKMEADGGQRCRVCNIVIEPDLAYCPCCERQIKEENAAYMKFMKKYTIPR